ARSGPAGAVIAKSIPAATLGTPVPAVDSPTTPLPAAVSPYPSPSALSGAAALAAPVADGSLAPASYEAAPGPRPVTGRSPPPRPGPPPPVLSGQAPVLPPGGIPVAPPLPPGDVPPPVLGPPGATYGGVAIDQPIKKSFLDRCKDWLNPGNPDSKCGGWFQTDHAFDSGNNCADLISPVSMPFLFEDPRALTEVRPIFIYQTAPHPNPASPAP